MRLFVIGATGGIGRQLVEQALERGHLVTAFVRAPEKLGAPREGLTVLRGDPLDPKALSAALSGHDAVLSALGAPGPGRSTVTGDGARAAVAAMQAAGVWRLLVVGVALLFEDAGWIGAVFRKTLLRNVAHDHAEMERIVKASGLEWTIVRPPRLTNGALTQRYGVTAERLPPGAGRIATVSRADVAHFLLDEVERPAHERHVVGIADTKISRKEHKECDLLERGRT
jgi:putative NADH-flavin reductase